jgi:hypothetical protein
MAVCSGTVGQFTQAKAAKAGISRPVVDGQRRRATANHATPGRGERIRAEFGGPGY